MHEKQNRAFCHVKALSLQPCSGPFFHLHIFRKSVYVFIPPQHSALAPIGPAGVKRYRDHKAVLYGVLEADLSAATLLTASLERTDNGSHGNYWHHHFGLPLNFNNGTPMPFLGRGANMAPP